MITVFCRASRSKNGKSSLSKSVYKEENRCWTFFQLEAAFRRQMLRRK